MSTHEPPTPVAHSKHLIWAVPPVQRSALAHRQIPTALSPSGSTYLCAPTDCTSVISTVFTKDTAFRPPYEGDLGIPVGDDGTWWPGDL